MAGYLSTDPSAGLPNTTQGPPTDPNSLAKLGLRSGGTGGGGVFTNPRYGGGAQPTTQQPGPQGTTPLMLPGQNPDGSLQPGYHWGTNNIGLQFPVKDGTPDPSQPGAGAPQPPMPGTGGNAPPMATGMPVGSPAYGAPYGTPPGGAPATTSPGGGRLPVAQMGERRSFNGQIATWDGRGWAVGG